MRYNCCMTKANRIFFGVLFSGIGIGIIIKALVDLYLTALGPAMLFAVVGIWALSPFFKAAMWNKRCEQIKRTGIESYAQLVSLNALGKKDDVMTEVRGVFRFYDIEKKECVELTDTISFGVSQYYPGDILSVKYRDGKIAVLGYVKYDNLPENLKQHFTKELKA